MKLYFRYDANQTPESNITNFGYSVSSWLNDIAETWNYRYNDTTSTLNVIKQNVNRVANALEQFPEKFAEALKQSVDDAAVDAMRKELAALITKNAELTRKLEGLQNDAGRDNQEERAAEVAGGQAASLGQEGAASTGDGEDDDQRPGQGRQDDRSQDTICPTSTSGEAG